MESNFPGARIWRVHEWPQGSEQTAAVALARNFDAPIAFGHPNSLQMPSKAVQYLTLPVPRVAITSGARDDALADYLADKPGWLCSELDSPALAERLGDHISRPWSADGLAPPASERGLRWPTRSPRS